MGWLHSPLLADLPEIRHAYSTKLTETPSTWAKEAGFFPNLATMHQVHGAGCEKATKTGLVGTADAIWTDQTNLALIVQTADCLPVLMVGGLGRALTIAAVHAGWRGLAAGVLEAQVASFTAQGILPKDLYAAIGPCISIDGFEVGPEVVTSLRQRLGTEPRARMGPRGRPHVDLVDVATQLLTNAGLSRQRIACVDECTFNNPDRYHSYRRDGGGGRQISAIMIEPS